MKISCVKGKREAAFQAAEYGFVVYGDMGKINHGISFRYLVYM